LDQQVVKEMAQHERVVLLCGHYEGVDERVGEHLATQQLSIGDYVVSGGEVAALVVMEVVARFVPGFLGNAGSLCEESHSSSGIVEYPQYTRPADFRGMKVPEVLLSGHHKEIEKWRGARSEQRSRRREDGEVARRKK
jgi:tRNA (guanine37-N1)-methyltransferase